MSTTRVTEKAGMSPQPAGPQRKIETLSTQSSKKQSFPKDSCDGNLNRKTEDELIQDALADMAKNELPLDGQLVIDGHLHRYSRKRKKNEPDEWYIAFAGISDKGNPYLNVVYGTFSGGFAKFHFNSWKKNHAIPKEEREAINELWEEQKRNAEEQHAKEVEERRAKAVAEWEKGADAPNTAQGYLDRKRVGVHGVRFGIRFFNDGTEENPVFIQYDTILVPLRNIDGDLCAVQHICADGEKRITGSKSGNFHQVGVITQDSVIFVAEGYSTGVSAYEVIGKPTVVAVDCGNLLPVVESLKKKYPKNRIIILGDDDVETVDRTTGELCNPGRKHAEAAAKIHRCRKAFPKFPEDFRLPNGERPTDWNDLRVHFGNDEVERQLSEVLEAVTIDYFVIEPGKTHLTAQKAKEILADPKCGVFQRLGQTVRIVKYITAPKTKKNAVARPDGAFLISEVDDIFLVKLLSERAIWERYDKRTKANEPIDFPEKAARFILSDRGDGLPVLIGFVCSPTLREDGSLLDVPGYDPASGLFFDPCGSNFPTIPHNPSKEDAQKSLDFLKDLLKDFKFDGEISHSVAIAEIMTGVIRRSLDLSPAFGNNAPEAGSGKSLLGDVTSIIATGNRCTCVSPSNNEEENRKRIASALIGGDLVVCIDNVQEPFESDSMCTILTSPHWQERLLGTNTNVQIPTNSIFIFTGNNLTFRGDMCSRVIMCHIDPQTERPGERHFDRDLKMYAAKNRGEFVAAILTIIRAYIVAGCPDQGISPFRLYSEWTKWIRSSLVWLGMKDPYESTRSVTDNDPVREELGALFSTWYRTPTESSSIKQLLEMVNSKEKRDQNEDIQALYDTLIEFAPDGKGGISSERLGKRLRQCKGRIVKGYRLGVAGKDRRNAVTWRISKV